MKVMRCGGSTESRKAAFESDVDEQPATGAVQTVYPRGGDAQGIQAYVDSAEGGGWVLLYAYRHVGGTNPELVGNSLPTSPTSGFSHANVNQLGGFVAEDVVAVRLFARTSAHSRVIHFMTTNPNVCKIAWDGKVVISPKMRDFARVAPSWPPRAPSDLSWAPNWHLAGN